MMANVDQFIFALNATLAWVMKSKAFSDLLAKWSPEYNKIECAGDGSGCYGMLAVSIIGIVLSSSLPDFRFIVHALP